VTFDLDLRRGWVGEELRAEFPELGLVHATLAARTGRSPRAVRERLKVLSDRFTGPKAVQVRQQPVPWAYRVFFRQIGIDPDERRTPPEAMALERMRAGAFKSHNLLDDAIVIATVETGVPLLAYDAGRLDGEPGLRLAEPGERLGVAGRDLRGGEIVVADAGRPLGVLFGDAAVDPAVSAVTEQMLIAAVRVKGVPEVSVEEALWIAAEVLTEPG
jgi:DNA/RNA-binding domain of Phe-tRNA-synthetase-like protein